MSQDRAHEERLAAFLAAGPTLPLLPRAAGEGHHVHWSGATAHELLTFTVAGQLHALPIRQVREVAKLPPLLRVPRLPDRVLGLMSLRGDLLPVLDAARVFNGAAPSAPGTPTDAAPAFEVSPWGTGAAGTDRARQRPAATPGRLDLTPAVGGEVAGMSGRPGAGVAQDQRRVAAVADASHDARGAAFAVAAAAPAAVALARADGDGGVHGGGPTTDGGQAPAQPAVVRPGHVIVLGDEDAPLGLAVDRLLGVRRLPDEAVVPRPPLGGAAAARECVAGFAKLGHETVVVLDGEAVQRRFAEV